MAHLRADWWAFAIALLLTPAAAALNLVQPYLLKRVIDDHIVPGAADGLMALAVLFLAAVVVGYLLQGGYVLALSLCGFPITYRLLGPQARVPGIQPRPGFSGTVVPRPGINPP